MENDMEVKNLLIEVEKLHHKFELSKIVGPDYYEPGMMEYMDKHEGIYDEENGIITLHFDSRGTRYDGRTELLEKINRGDMVNVVRDAGNRYNSNNFVLYTEKNKDIGNMPAELCNVIAPLYDKGQLVIISAKVSFVEPISKRNRHAKQAVLFVEVVFKLIN